MALQDFDNYAAKGRFQDMVGNALRPKTEWAADNGIGKSREAKIEYAKATGSAIAAAGIALASMTVLPFVGVVIAGPLIAINILHARIASNNYQLLNIQDLLADRDVAELKKMIRENEQLAQELKKYKGMPIKDLPAGLKKRSAEAIRKEYETMKNLKLELARIKV